MTLAVDVQNASTAPEVPPAPELVRFAEAAAGAVLDGDAEMSVRIVDGEEGAALNAAYRGREGATNVLSFPFDAGDLTDPPLLGDVVVCAPVVLAEARAQGKAPDAHFAHMVVHGVLHLLGHDHRDEAEAAAMEDLEREVLGGLGFADPYRPAGDGGDPAPARGERP